MCECSINCVQTAKQLNVNGAGKEAGTEIITYAFAEVQNAQFLLKAV